MSDKSLWHTHRTTTCRCSLKFIADSREKNADMRTEPALNPQLLVKLIAILQLSGTCMKAIEFSVVAEAKRAAHGQMRFFNSMMAAKTASNSPHKGSSAVAAKQVAARKDEQKK